jgi:HlyD family secretion protein
MTAYVNVVVAQRRGVLLVPNAALRFKPAADVPLTKSTAGAQPPGPRAVVYKLSGRTLVAVPLETGIADSRYTEVLQGDLQAGERVVTEDLQAAKNAPAGTVRMRMF